METKVAFQMTLTQPTNKLVLDGPCACCNEPATETFPYQKDYPLSVWAASSKGTLTKVAKKDKDGKNAMGLFEFDLPYCAKHLAQTKKLHKVHSRQNNTAIWVAVVAVVLFFAVGGLTWFSNAETTGQAGFRLCAVPIFLFLGVGGILKFSLDSWNKTRAAQPEFADFPLDSQSGGGSGVGIEITEQPIEGTKRTGTDVHNYLQLNFKNVEAAKRFSKKYPNIRVIQGKDKLQ